MENSAINTTGTIHSSRDLLDLKDLGDQLEIQEHLVNIPQLTTILQADHEGKFLFWISRICERIPKSIIKKFHLINLQQEYMIEEIVSYYYIVHQKWAHQVKKPFISHAKELIAHWLQ